MKTRTELFAQFSKWNGDPDDEMWTAFHRRVLNSIGEMESSRWGVRQMLNDQHNNLIYVVFEREE